MILSTSTRLGRVVDRVRAIAIEIEELANEPPEMVMLEEKRAMIFDQLDRLTSRSRLLQRSLTVFYMSVAIFVATSVAIGVVAAIQLRYSWVPVILGLIGSCFLFYGSILMILEARLALNSIHIEMDFLWQLGKRHVPAELAAARRSERIHLTRPHD